jgi:phosphatidylinositol-bisphosphatase
MGMLLPGEEQRIELTMCVDHRTAPMLNMQPSKLEDIVILHLENGKDYFVSVSGSYIPTCFGIPLDVLVHLKQPIRSYPSGDIPNPSTLPSQPPMSVPKELWRMVDDLYKHGMQMNDMFLASGDPSLVTAIRRCLDTGDDFPTLQDNQDDGLRQRVNAMAESLVRWLDALPVPVIPFDMYQRCLDAYQNTPMAQHLIMHLPPVHHHVFVYVVSFLRECITVRVDEEQRKEFRDRVAVVFGAVMLRSEVQPSARRVQDVLVRKKTAFMMLFLDDDEGK